MRRGQIFLILTILVITFMVGITAVLLDIQRANYYSPAPETSSVLNAWDLTIDAIQSTFQVQTAIESQTRIADVTSAPVDISNALNNIEQYIVERGFLITINSLVNPNFTLNGYNTATLSLSLTGSYSIVISSNNVEINQVIDLTLSYTVDATSGTAAIISKNAFGESSFIQGVTFQGTTATDMANGLYQTAPGNTYTGITQNGVLLQFTT